MPDSGSSNTSVTLFLCGDVMTGRGIDQILPHACHPRLYEPAVTDARDYVDLARDASGSIDVPVSPEYIWGDALEQLERHEPDLRLVNLETSITDSHSPWPEKGIHYRMHPDNVEALTVAGLDGCALANNHVLDWDHTGLRETLATLEREGIRTSGAGENARDAGEPAVFRLSNDSRVVFLSCGLSTSGIPSTWAATDSQPGVFLLPDLSAASVELIRQRLKPYWETGDRVVVSIHWGSNWGYEIPPDQQTFAHALIDELDVDVVHGHSSHHPRPIEVYRDKLILYGCGDFINDYEGIGGNEGYRGDLTLMYFPSLAADGRLQSLRMVPMQLRRLSLQRPAKADVGWLRETLQRINLDFGTGCELAEDGQLRLTWGDNSQASRGSP